MIIPSADSLSNAQIQPAGVRDPQNYSLYAQWKELSERIKDYIDTHPVLSGEKIIELLSFNAQYLVKIADYSLYDAPCHVRDISPLTKELISYHRDYKNDNRLLYESVQVLKNIRWPNGFIYLVSNNCYIRFMKIWRTHVHLSYKDSEAKGAKKLEKHLHYLDTTPLHLIKSHLFVLLEEDRPLGHTTNKDILEKMDAVKKIIDNYSWKDPKNKVAVIKTILWSITYNLPGGLKILVTDEWGKDDYVNAIKRGGSTPTLQQAAHFYAQTFYYAQSFMKKDEFYTHAIGNSSITLQPPTFTNSFPATQSPFDFLRKGSLNLLKRLDKTKEQPVAEIVGQGIIHHEKDAFNAHLQLPSEIVERVAQVGQPQLTKRGKPSGEIREPNPVTLSRDNEPSNSTKVSSAFNRTHIPSSQDKQIYTHRMQAFALAQQCDTVNITSSTWHVSSPY